MAAPEYDLATYRRNRRLVLAGSPLCSFGCGRLADTADHILPRSKGGGPELENLRPACRSCNSARGDRVVQTHRLRW